MISDEIPLTLLTRRQGANRAVLDGEVTPDPYRLHLVDEPVLVEGFRRMVRGLEFDVAEMALTTYLTARDHGVAFTALPIFLVRGLHHGAIQVRRDATIRTARDLTGQRVGVSRGYTVTTGVWARAWLSDSGLDLDSVTWVLSDDEHVEEYRHPANVLPATSEVSLVDLLLAGDLDAVIGAGIDHPDVTTLFSDPVAAGLDAWSNTGVFPINHLVVVRDDVLAAHPHLAPAVFEAFAESKRRYVAALREGLRESVQDDVLSAIMSRNGGVDPLPYGVEPNRRTLEALIGHARAQHIVTRAVNVDDLFVEGVEHLTG